jgi:hypothetical protein
MTEANTWTTDLREMAEIFLKYHPDKKVEISEIQKLIEKPNDGRKALQLIDTYGKWISKKYYTL